MVILVAVALPGCGGEGPSSTAGAAVAPTPVAASLSDESLDRDGDGVVDAQRTYEGLEPLTDVELPAEIR